MTLQLDHMFLITRSGAPEAEAVCDLGFTEGRSNHHPGQGTANRRFFFENFTLELLYVSDAEEARTGAGRALGILAREADALASPFGIVVRQTPGAGVPSFPHWRYHPDYFPQPMCFFVGANSELPTEPLCICMPLELNKPAQNAGSQDNPGWFVTNVTLETPVQHPSDTLRSFASIDGVSIDYGKPHHLTLTFNAGTDGRTCDLQPVLPLTLRW